MDTNVSGSNFEYVVENAELSIEQVTSNVCSFDEANIILTTNNITTTDETDPLAIPLDVEASHGLKPCFVELTRCDNIWKTFQLIRDLQEDRNSECGEKDDNVKVKQEEDEPASSMNDNESYSSSTQASNTMAPYIKYQPVLNNGNSALNFQFSVKSTRLLYQCHECGKQYSHRQTLREHSERIHNIILPIMRKKPENTSNDSKTIQSKIISDCQENNDVNRDEMSSTSTDNPENSINEMQDDGALLDNASDTQLSDKELSTSSECKIYRCLYCNRQYKDKYYFNYHLKNTHGTSIAGIRAYKKRSTENDNKDNHNNNDTNEPRFSKKTRRVQQIDQSRSLNVHRCDTCGKHFYDKARLGDHLRKVHGIFRRNHMNNRIRPNKSNNRKVTTSATTTKLDHDARKIHQCIFCEKTYADRQSWRKHLTSIHGVTFATFSGLSKGPRRNMSCKECGREYLWRRSLVEHLYNVHGQRLQHECDTCGLRFQSSDSLIKHALDIHKIMLVQRIVRRGKDRHHKCHVCFTHYGLKRNLAWHLLEAHGIKNLGDSKNIKREPVDMIEEKPMTRRRPPPPSPKALRKGLRDKARINYSEATESRSVEQLLLGDTVRNKENVDASEEIDMNGVSCFLCHRRCIKIRRHFIEYHKIEHPDAIMAQCKPASSTNVIDNNTVADRKISKDTKTSIKIENVKQEMRNNHTRIRNFRSIDPNRLFVKSMSQNGRATYRCKICPNYVRGVYELLRKHEKLHRRQKVPSPIDESEIEQHEMNSNRKRKRESVDNRDTRRPRLSDSVEHTRTTRASMKLKEEREFRCTVCDRLFRNAEILSSHKISCVTYHGENSSMNDASDTRESSDRDSGIGISITIKKRNNSYEIVGREGNEDEKLPNSPEKIGGLKDDASVSDNSSEAFAIATNDKSSSTSEKSIPYSKNHIVVKIQKAEENDVDIDLESISGSPTNIACENNHEVTSSGQDDTSEISNSRMDSAEPHKVLSLKQLCENLLANTKNNDKLSFKCNVCSTTWSSKAARSAHMRIHSRPTRF